MCLATNEKLFKMNLIDSSDCNKCTDGRVQSSLHMFYQCSYIRPLFIWTLKCLLNICNFTPSSPIRFLYFDNIYINSSQKNICNVFLYIYIITIWRTRKENLRIANLKHAIIRKLHEYRSFIKQMPNQISKRISEDLAGIDIDNMINL